MITAVRRSLSDVAWMAFGALCMLIAAPLVIQSWQWMHEWYDRVNPPAKAALMSHEYLDATTLRLRFAVTRGSRECEFVRLQGYTGATLGQMQLATTMRREDGQDPATYPSGSTVRSQPWLLAPVYGKQLLIVGHYDCTGRLVRSRLIDEVLP